jgi:hypothetical protein
MGNGTKTTRENRTITVDFHDESNYFQLICDGTAFVEFVLAFVLSIGFQVAHKATCRGGGCLTRHSHYARLRLGGLTIWRIQCASCKAVCTVLPHFIGSSPNVELPCNKINELQGLAGPVATNAFQQNQRLTDFEVKMGYKAVAAMATINTYKAQNGQTTYRVRIQRKGLPTQTTTFPSLSAAKRWARMVEGQIAEGRYFGSLVIPGIHNSMIFRANKECPYKSSWIL